MGFSQDASWEMGIGLPPPIQDPVVCLLHCSLNSKLSNLSPSSSLLIQNHYDLKKGLIYLLKHSISDLGTKLSSRWSDSGGVHDNR